MDRIDDLTADVFNFLIQLRRLDANAQRLHPLLRKAYGEGRERHWLMNWRLFFITLSELFGYAGGNEWRVSHLLFAKREAPL